MPEASAHRPCRPVGHVHPRGGHLYVGHVTSDSRGLDRQDDCLQRRKVKSRDAIEEIIEPFLIQRGFIQRTPRGRKLTPRAFRNLSLAEPTREPSRFGLFTEEE